MALSEYDDALEELDPQTATAKPNVYDALLDERDASQSQGLRTAVAQAQTTTPDRAAKVRELSTKTGLPADTVDRNFDAIAKKVTTDDVPYERIQEQSPTTAAWLSQSDNAKVAHDDMASLGALEWLLKAPQRAVAQTLNAQQYGALRTASLYRDLTQDEQDRMSTAKLHMTDDGALGTTDHWFRGAITGGIKLATMLASTMPVYGLAGAAGGGLLGSLAGPEGTVAGIKLGFEAGNVYGLGKMSFQTEAANAYDSYLQIRDEHNQPIDPKVARIAALATGALNAGLMLGAGKVLLESMPAIPGLDKLGAPFIRDAVSQALAKPTVRAALMDAAKTYGATLTEGTALMVGMRAVNILGGELAKSADAAQSDRRYDAIGPSEVGRQLMSAAAEAAQSFALPSALGPAMSFMHDAARATRAKDAPAFFQALGEGVTQSKTAQRLPDAARDFIHQATKDGPIATVYAPIETWNTYWQGQGIDPAEVARRVTGSTDAYANAASTGGDLPIETSRYATTLAATEHNAFFANELRLGPDEMNGREAAAFAEQVKQTAASAASSEDSKILPRAKVREAVLGQLEGAGVPRETAEHYAALYESTIGTLADRAGVDPAQLFEQYGLKVEREGMPPAEGAAAAADGTPAPEAPIQGVLPSSGQPVDESGRTLGGYAGTERRTDTAAYTGEERRNAPLAGSVAERAAAMRAENPNIEADAAAMRESASGRVKPSARAVVDKNQDAAQNPGGYFNAPRTSGAAEEGAGSGNAEGQQPVADAGGRSEGRSDGPGAESGRLPTADLPGLDEVFVRQTKEEVAGRLTDPVKRELSRILEELQTFTYEPRYWHWLDPREKKTGNAGGGDAIITAGHAGAPVYDDIKYFSPLNQKGGKAAKKVHGTRGDVADAIDALIKTGEVKTNLQEGALRVAMNRAADNYEYLSAPSLPHADGPIASVEFTDALSEAIDQASTAAVNLLDEASLRDEDSILEPDGPVDTSFNVSEFEQSLFDDVDQPDPIVDTLTTGEGQPRLPGAEGVRSQEQTTPHVAEAPFALTSEIAKPRAGKNRELFQTAYHGTPHVFEQFSLHAIGNGEGNQAYGWGLYFTSTKAIAERYAEAVVDNKAIDGINAELSRIAKELEKHEISYGRYRDPNAPEGPALRAEYDRLFNERADIIQKPGHVVTAEIPDDENMLDYDKPASQQPANVQAALKALGVNWNPIEIPSTKDALKMFNSAQVDAAANAPSWTSIGTSTREALTEGLYYATTGNQPKFDAWYVKNHAMLTREGINDPTGAAIYSDLQSAAMRTKRLTLAQAAEAASKQLDEAGVHGIRYLDGFSRAEGDGSHNYVVFDDKLAKITEFNQPIELTPENVTAWAAEVQQRVGSDLQVFNVTLAGEDLKLNMFAVDRGARRAGLGASVMQELTRFADLNGKRIVLSPARKGDAWGTTSRGRLVDFYKRFGFVENTGRNADLSLSEGMYREPTLPRLGGELAQSDERPSTIAEGSELPQQRRGAIRFGPDRQFTIRLLERADPSTFLHESGHFFLEVMGDLVDRVNLQDETTRTDTQRQLVSDYGQLLDHFGVESRGQIGTAQHEEFAKTFEAYLMEGKAPDLALQGSFARFRAWLIGVYRTLTNLKVNLTPEVRAVLDRLVASDRAIQDAEAQRGVVQMFTTPEMAGMTPDDFALYRNTVERASRTAREQLDAKLFADVARERQADFRAQRAEVKATVENEIHQRPEYQAIAAMTRGTHPNGEPLVEGMETAPLQLDRQTIVDRYGADRVKRLPRGIVASEHGVDPDTVARMFGFNSGDALLTAVEHAAPMKALIDQNVKQRMVAQYGDTLLDGSLHEKAQAAVANEDRDIVIRAELRALNNLRRTVRPFVQAERKKGAAVADELRDQVSDLKAQTRGGAATIRAGIPPAGVLRQAAEDRINGLRIGSIQPQAFWSASRRSATMAIERAARQDFDGAIQAKTQELINVNLYRKAEAALEAVNAGVSFARSLTTNVARQRIGLAGGGYLEQIDGLLDRFDFAKVPDTVLERRANLRDWAEALSAQGLPADQIPQALLDEARRVNYREMSLDEFTGVIEGLRQINHLAQLKNRLLKAQDARDFGQVRDDVTSTIYANNERRPVKLEYSAADERFRSITGWFAAHRKISNIAQALDGYEDGGSFWTAFMKPINEAADTEAVRRIDEAGRYLDLIDKHYPAGEIRTMQDKVDVPSVGALSKEARLAVALNWGNETSRDRVLSDPMRGWNREQVNAILDTLDKRDWDFVQDTWNYINTFWSEIAAKQERVTGVAPEKVEAVPVETKFGTYDGGYYPLSYDSRMSPRVAQNELASQAKLQATAAYVRTTTRRGHVEARRSNVRLPIRLDLSVVHSHVDQVLHDLTHHETLIDATRLLRDPKISRAIIETQGDQIYGQLTAGIQDIALGGANGPRTALDKAATFMRSGTQIAQLGWNFWTAMQQPLGLFNGMARVGPGWIAKGVGRWLRDAATMNSTAAWINEVSPMMRERAFNATQDLSDLRMAFRQPGGWFDSIVRKVTNDHLSVEAITDSMLWHIGMAQRVADIPTWLGQYEKSMAGGETQDRAFRIADQAVLDSHGHGAVKDLAQVQRGGPVARLFMTFYSYGNTVFNATAREIDQVSFRSPASVGKFLGHLGMLYVMPAMATVAMQDVFGKKRVKDYLADVGREGLSTALNTMVFVRELAALAQEGNRGYGGPAGTRFFQLLDELGAQVKQGKPDEGLAKALNGVGGVLLHYPATQMQKTIDGWAALEEGRTKNPAALIVGPPPKNQQP